MKPPEIREQTGDRNMTITPWENPVFEPIRDALVQRMLALDWDESKTTAEHPDWMMRGWDHFSDNSMDERGHLTCYDWMDSRIAWLLD